VSAEQKYTVLDARISICPDKATKYHSAQMQVRVEASRKYVRQIIIHSLHPEADMRRQ